MLFRTAFSRLLFLSAILIAASTAFGQTTGFTYQGSLSNGGHPANGQYDFQFKLFDASTSGGQISSSVTKNNITVSGGHFSVTLDFGSSAFAGVDRWLEIGTKLSSDPTFTILTPRQQIVSAPYAIQSLNATTATTAITATTATTANNTTLLGGLAASQYVLTGDARLSNARVASSVNFGTATLSGALPINKGGTGASAQTFVDLSSDQTAIGGNKSFNGRLSGTFSGGGSSLIKVPGTLQWQVVTGTSQQALSNNGYAANNAGQVIITLPTSPSVGDTVRVSGLGAGGWKIVQNAGQTIVGTNLNLSGVSWTPRDSSRGWFSVASSADGSALVAVASDDRIYTSTDSGANWTPRDSSRLWASVASSADGSKLIAAANNGQIYTSTDSGVSWTPRDSNRGWFGVASSADGSRLVAVVLNGQIYTSTDSGASWTARDSSRQWIAVASSADGNKLVAVVIGGQIYTSTDSGVSWTPRDSNRSWFSVASSADGSELVAAALGGQIYTSTDSGASWIPRETNRQWRSVASSADGNMLVAVVSNGQIYTSTDSGATWTPRDSNRQWISAASSADGSKLVALVQNGQIYTSDSTTTSGVSGFLTGAQYAAIELQYIGNGLFLQISRVGTITGF